MDWVESLVRGVHYRHIASLTACSLSTLVTSQRSPTMCNRKAIMVITGRAHCIHIYIYIFIQNGSASSSLSLFVHSSLNISIAKRSVSFGSYSLVTTSLDFQPCLFKYIICY